ncbi:MAG: DUF5011 domain-containing protein, partial [Bacteroidia bacterium]|nr:DUF5011 domain-containing protein [Bacteroidia bacterium]
SPVSADFIVPNTIWIKTVRQFVNKNSTGYIQHAWDFNNDGTYEQIGKSPNIQTNYNTWTSPGTKCIKLSSTNCLGTDSIVKCFNVLAPASVPIVDFVASNNYIQQYEVAKFHDISENGPYQWKWDVYDSISYASQGYYPSLASGDVIADPSRLGFNELTSNPEFEFDVPGCYTVLLTAINDVGPSAPRIKKCYITVSLPNIYNIGFGTYGLLGDNHVETPTGIISDNGGRFLNYDNNQGIGSRSYLSISPCNAKKITLQLNQIKLKDNNDKLRIWDGKTAGGPGSNLLAVFDNNSKGPKKLIATSGHMYILFESNATGNDSGFYGFYTSELGPAILSKPEFKADVSQIYAGRPISFYNHTPNIVGVPEWYWTIDSQSIPNNKNKDLHYTFNTSGQYKLCLDMKTCAGKNRICSTINVVMPNKQSDLNLTVSKEHPELYETVNFLFHSQISNRFELTINPKTFVLINPPPSPSSITGNVIKYLAMPGDTFPIPIIKFTEPGCYSIQLKGYNSNDSTNTSKTIQLNDRICILNYCQPVSYILSKEIGINTFRLYTNKDTLIEKTSSTGTKAYFNYTDSLSAHLNYCNQYNMDIERKSYVEAMNVSAYIDWNIDGDFDDLGEQIATINANKSAKISFNFSVPSMNVIGNGKTRLRVVALYNNQSTSPCGPFTLGETEDYTVWLDRDSVSPIITLVGNDTIRIKTGTNYQDFGAIAIDNLEGDISADIHTINNVDETVPGQYEVTYLSCDCSGNCIDKKRIIIVSSEIIPPVIQLNPDNTICIEAKRDNLPYIDPGAIAYSISPFLSLTHLINVTGYVDTRTVGQYQLTYQVTDPNGVSAMAFRNVCVEDHLPPLIITPNDTNIQLGSIWLDPTYVVDEYDLNPELEKLWQSNHPLNTQKRKIYHVRYTAIDQSGNEADTVYVYYKVDDFIDPVIHLNTEDIVYHEVRTAYQSTPVSVIDNYYDGSQIVVTRTFSNVNDFKLGVYYEIFEAVDGSGNISKKTRTVIVNDKTPPRIWGNSIRGCVGENIWPYWGLYTSDNYYTTQELKPYIQIISQNINIWEEGIYQITYRATDPSGNTSEPFIRYVQYTYPPNCQNSTTDISSIDSLNNYILIFPNPVNNYLNIQISEPIQEQASLTIMDMTGRTVIKIHLNTAFETIDLSEIPSGVYSVSILNGATIISKTITVQH